MFSGVAEAHLVVLHMLQGLSALLCDNLSHPPLVVLCQHLPVCCCELTWLLCRREDIMSYSRNLPLHHDLRPYGYRQFRQLPQREARQLEQVGSLHSNHRCKTRSIPPV